MKIPAVGDKVVYYQGSKGVQVMGIIRELDGGFAYIVAHPSAPRGFGTKKVPLERVKVVEDE